LIAALSSSSFFYFISSSFFFSSYFFCSSVNLVTFLVYEVEFESGFLTIYSKNPIAIYYAYRIFSASASSLIFGTATKISSLLCLDPKYFPSCYTGLFPIASTSGALLFSRISLSSGVRSMPHRL